MRLLVAEDDDDLRDVLERGLIEAGYVVDVVADGAAAVEYLRAYEYAACICDWRMPIREGIDVIADARRRGIKTPFMMLTARDAPTDRVAALDQGADDYLVKPFDYAELLARIRALIRRADGSPSPVLRAGSLSLDPATHETYCGTTRVDLTPREFAILELLLRKAPTVVHRAAIAIQAWPDESEAVGSNTIDVHIARLRSKIARSDARIETVRGAGYRIIARDK